MLDLYRANIQSPDFQQRTYNFRSNFQIQSTAISENFMYDLTKKRLYRPSLCLLSISGLPLSEDSRQREANQNSQIDQSQAGIDVNRHQADLVYAHKLKRYISGNSDFSHSALLAILAGYS